MYTTVSPMNSATKYQSAASVSQMKANPFRDPESDCQKKITQLSVQASQQQERVTVSEHKIKALFELQAKITAIQNALKRFESKQVTITTNDSGQDYLAVSASSEVAAGDFSVRVLTVASYTRFTLLSLCFGSPAIDDKLLGFQISQPKATSDTAAIPSDFTLQVETEKPPGNSVTIQIQAGETMKQIQDKINQHPQLQCLRATLIKSGSSQAGIHSLSLQRRETGAKHIGAKHIGITSNETSSQPLGRDAKVEINGLSISCQSNIIKDAIDGITLMVKKINSLDSEACQTVQVGNNFAAAMKDLVQACNDYSIFAAKMQERLATSAPATTAYLADSMALSCVHEHLSTTVQSLRYSTLGISYQKTAASQDLPSFAELSWDQNYRYDELTGAKILTNILNQLNSVEFRTADGLEVKKSRFPDWQDLITQEITNRKSRQISYNTQKTDYEQAGHEAAEAAWRNAQNFDIQQERDRMIDDSLDRILYDNKD